MTTARLAGHAKDSSSGWNNLPRQGATRRTGKNSPLTSRPFARLRSLPLPSLRPNWLHAANPEKAFCSRRAASHIGLVTPLYIPGLSPMPPRPAARRPEPRYGSSMVNGKSVFNPPLVVDILTSASRLAGSLTRTLPLVEANSMSPAPLSCMISTSTVPLVDLPLTVTLISPTWTSPLVDLALTAPVTPLTVTLPLVDLASRSPLTPVTSTSPLVLEIGSNL